MCFDDDQSQRLQDVEAARLREALTQAEKLRAARQREQMRRAQGMIDPVALMRSLAPMWARAAEEKAAAAATARRRAGRPKGPAVPAGFVCDKVRRATVLLDRGTSLTTTAGRLSLNVKTLRKYLAFHENHPEACVCLPAENGHR